MSTEKLASGARAIFERVGQEQDTLSAQELTLDGSNKVSFPGFPYIFEALGERILVSIDIFKSGYECKVCKGRKTLESKCHCEEVGRAGSRYSYEEISAIREALGDDIANERAALSCPECRGDYISMRKVETCDACKGRGAILHLPDSSKNLPTTGVVVSMGNLVDPEKANFKVGDRILFGPYAGQMIPTKSGLLFKVLDWNNAMARIEGASELSQFDFILQDKEAE